MRQFLANIEIWLTLAGLGVIFLVPTLLLDDTGLYWRVTAITAIAVGVVHGMIFWVVRRQQRVIRRAAVAQIRCMLMDRVNNQLMVVLSRGQRGDREEDLERLKASVDDISSLIGSLDEESLTRWQLRYAQAQGAGRRTPEASGGAGPE